MSDLTPDSTPLSRVDLLRLAQSLGVSDADVMTRAELRAAIDKAHRPDPLVAEQPSTTWVSVARRLLASVVERGLNLPDAAALIRGDTKLNTPPKAPPPVATVTLARIYAAQGHLDRAIATLKEVLESDPDHDLASELRAQLEIRRAEMLARTNTGRGAVADDASAPPASVAPASVAADVLDSVSERDSAPSQAVLAALASELAATAPESTAPATEAGPFAASTAEATVPAGPATQPGAVEEWPAPPYLVGGNGAPNDDPARVTHWNDERANVAGGDHASAHPIGDVAPPPYILGSDILESDIAESDIAPNDGAVPEQHGTAATPQPAPLSLDATAELVAPAFETIARDASATEIPPPALRAEAPTIIDTLSLDAEVAAPPSHYPETETEPPPTIATGVDLPSMHEPEPMPATSAAPSADSTPAEEGAAQLARVAAGTPHAGADLGTLGHGTPGYAAPAHAANGVVNGAALVAEPASAPMHGPAPMPPAPPPEAPGLLLIETDTPTRYVYWELSAPDPSRPHWIHVVSHTPTAGGSAERRERSFPVHRALGAVRLEGLPPHAVVRAKLTQTADDPRTLVVASSVRSRHAAGAEAFEIRYAPHTRARPEAIAHRATPMLEQATPVYWD